MRFIFLILALYCGSAQAQYTTMSSKKAPTTYQQPAPVAQQPVRPVAQPTQPTVTPSYTTQKQVAPTTAQPTATPSYTTQRQVAPTTAQPTATPSYTTQRQVAPAAQPNTVKSYTTQKKVAPTQQAVRPTTSFRPVAPKTNDIVSVEGEDSLPSFEAFKQNKMVNSTPGQNPTASQNGASAQQPRPLIIPKGEIWITRSGFENRQNKSGGFKSCDWKLAIQNRTDTTIGRIRIELKTGSRINTYIISGIKPGEYLRKESNSEGFCPSAEVRPTVKVLSCKFGDVAGNKCADYFVVK
ncbi:MAG: hypothetical protein MJ250_07530 [Alphaproteobacteria bacterium]|nr:hypothetical protein [Alphaproteobacteria bacterium]